MLGKLSALAALVVCVNAQDLYTVAYKATISGAQTAVSVQLPAKSSQTEILEATIQCSATCTIRMESNGAASVVNGSSIVAITPVALNPESTPADLIITPNVNAFSGSGIPVGTQVGPTWTIPAGGLMPFGSGRIMIGNGPNVNYIIRVPTAYTGDVAVYLSLRVRR
jgi:hypothetical protein